MKQESSKEDDKRAEEIFLLLYLVRRKKYSTTVISADTVSLWSKRAIWNSGHLILLFVCFQSISFSYTNKMFCLCDINIKIGVHRT